MLYVPSMSNPKHSIRRKAWPWNGKELRVWLEQHNYTQVQLAREFGCRPDRIRQWIHNNRRLPYGTYMALKLIIGRDRDRATLKGRRRVQRQLRERRAYDKAREARLEQIREGGGLESEEKDYL